MAKTYESEPKLRCTSDGRIEVTVPTEVVEDFEIGHEQPYRITPELNGTEVTFRIDLGDRVTGELSNERTFRQYGENSGRSTQTKQRWPTHIARALRLHSFADENDVETTFEKIDDQTYRISTWPPVEPVNGNNDRVEELSPAYKSFLEIPNDDKPTGVQQFRLDFPTAYGDQYQIEKGDDVTFLIGTRNGQLALIIDLDPSDDVDRTRSIQHRELVAEGSVNPHSVYMLHIPKQLVHGLQEAIGTNVKLLPERKQIALI